MTSALQFAYAANIVILVPVLAGFVQGVDPVFEGRVTDSSGLRVLVFALWSAILLLSVAGLFRPRALWPVLALQVIYKSRWLLLDALPLALRDGLQTVPWGVIGAFIAIVVVWPILLALAFLPTGVR